MTFQDDGLNTLITKIKTLYAKDINALTYMTYDQFENFKRSDEMTIVDYVNEFERLKNKIRRLTWFYQQAYQHITF